ncbi:GMP phosphodiesterase, delta subunit [Carpediemonas membranifera]|uniref:GMP phosphodiesterase, delta subunit n=1 Tax=Carpediemonas membranifera TaxID=201153 RepID=A0A8J6E3V1_9EUKA|nr:GMP phosphodiesterase, delta subunit [Carpediemonas membranifera]|eukprot:KAG9396413.1 GMP phosphodiesterase, delta subunit [Carpediemonas membranifera]
MTLLEATKAVQVPAGTPAPETAIDPTEGSKIDQIRAGFRINSMQMADATPGRPVEVMWVDDKWDSFIVDPSFRKTAVITRRLFDAAFVHRETTFSSKEEMHNFRIHQRLLLMGQEVEHWYFEFGFVIPNSTNTWQNVIEAAGPGKMIPPEVLHGNLCVETLFCEGEEIIGKATVDILIEELQ